MREDLNEVDYQYMNCDGWVNNYCPNGKNCMIKSNECKKCEFYNGITIDDDDFFVNCGHNNHELLEGR